MPPVRPAWMIAANARAGNRPPCALRGRCPSPITRAWDGEERPSWRLAVGALTVWLTGVCAQLARRARVSSTGRSSAPRTACRCRAAAASRVVPAADRWAGSSLAAPGAPARHAVVALAAAAALALLSWHRRSARPAGRGRGSARMSLAVGARPAPACPARRVPGPAAAAPRPRRRRRCSGCGSSISTISWTGSTASPASRPSRSASARAGAALAGAARRRRGRAGAGRGGGGAGLPALELASGADLPRRCRQRAARLCPGLAAAAAGGARAIGRRR